MNIRRTYLTIDIQAPTEATTLVRHMLTVLAEMHVKMLLMRLLAFRRIREPLSALTALNG